MYRVKSIAALSTRSTDIYDALRWKTHAPHRADRQADANTVKKKNAGTVDFFVPLPDVPGRVLLFRDTTQQTTRLGAWSDAARVSVRHPRDRSICAPLYQL